MKLRLLSDLLTKSGNLVIAVGNKLHESPHQESVRHFKNSLGNYNQLINYPINNTSLVFDVGGYLGQWTSDVFSIYQPTIYIFEPVRKHAEFIRNRFKKNKKVKVFEFGLSNKSQIVQITLNDNASSVFLEGSKKQKIILKRISDFIDSRKITRIDLLKINIEGAEFDLLDDLLASKHISKVKFLQIQFHSFVSNSTHRHKSLTEKLKLTHDQIYNFPFVWEAWKLK